MKEKVSRGHGLCDMLSDWRVFLPSVHQSRNRDAASVHACRGCPGQTSAADIDSCASPPYVLCLLLTVPQIAKMLQNLANKPSYSKEAYMMTLNPFVENNKARINQFLNNLCEVGDFYETLEVRMLESLCLVCFNLHQ
jgi:hypothetical protein